ncbi:MAG: HypC/HybG/HupF family hydrogenase formation chaperone [Thermoplasmatota archaeon]
MCLAVPGRVIEINGDNAEIDFGGITRKANISLVEAEKGDYVIVHAGYAIQLLDEEEAQESLDAWDEVMKAQEKMKEEV